MISIDLNQMMIEHYKEVIHVTSSEIKIRMKANDIIIKGINLHIAALSKYEIYIEGTLEGILFQYEK